MFTCHVCGSHEAKETLVSEVFQIKGEPALVEHIPAQVCAQCEEVIFDIDTAEHIRELLHSSAKPTKKISLPVFDFA